jgi:hypothetical protein
MTLSESSIIIIWTYQDMMEWMSRMLVGKKASADEDFGSEDGQMWLIFCSTPRTLIQLTTIHMGQMTLSEPSIVIIWTYQDMLEWMSRMLVGKKASAHVDFGSGDRQMLLIFCSSPQTLIQLSMIHMDQIILFRTINYHHLDISGHDGMNEQYVGWRNGWR